VTSRTVTRTIVTPAAPGSPTNAPPPQWVRLVVDSAGVTSPATFSLELYVPKLSWWQRAKLQIKLRALLFWAALTWPIGAVDDAYLEHMRLRSFGRERRLAMRRRGK